MEGKSKAELKAERRAIQEAQRAKKAEAQAASSGGAKGGGGGGAKVGGGGGGGGAKKEGGGGGGGGKQQSGGGGGGGGGGGSGPAAAAGSSSGGAPKTDDAKRVREEQKKQVTPRTPSAKQVALFSHLPQYEREGSLTDAAVAKGNIHRSVLRLGLQMAEGVITGSNARVVAMLLAFQDVIRDFTCPPAKVLSRELETCLKYQIQYLVDCRPQSMPMGNAIKWLKLRVGHAPPHLPEAEVKQMLCDTIDTYLHERIELADQAILSYAVQRIAPGDVLLVYSCSHLIETILLEAHKQEKKFRVIVADTGPKFEGRDMVKRLLAAGLSCDYANLHAASYVMAEVSKVLLGCSAMLLNGTLVGRAGTSLIAMLAHERGVPVLVCCETYKFAERVLLDAICYNELGDPDDLATPDGPISEWRDMPRLKLLNLVYDVTPTKFITMVVTEAGVIPPTSVPVIIREDHARAQLAADAGAA